VTEGVRAPYKGTFVVGGGGRGIIPGNVPIHETHSKELQEEELLVVGASRQEWSRGSRSTVKAEAEVCV